MPEKPGHAGGSSGAEEGKLLAVLQETMLCPSASPSAEEQQFSLPDVGACSKA